MIHYLCAARLLVIHTFILLTFLHLLWSQVYRICGQTVLCYPLVFEVSDFYLSHDMALLIDNIKTELHFVSKYWRLSGRPTVCILIREEHMRYSTTILSMY